MCFGLQRTSVKRGERGSNVTRCSFEEVKALFHFKVSLCAQGFLVPDCLLAHVKGSHVVLGFL